MISTAVSQDDLLYAAGGTNKVAKVWSRRDGREVASFMAAGPITSVIFISRGAETKLVVGTFGGHLHFFDVASGAEEKRHKFGKEHVLAGETHPRYRHIRRNPMRGLLAKIHS